MRRGRFAQEVAGLEPGWFAMVMATGILSTVALALRMPWLSVPLLPIAGAGYLVLCALTAWRLLRHWPRMLADFSTPGRAFGFFTFVAAGDVLGIRLALGGVVAIGEALMAVSTAAWLCLTYAIPARLIAIRPKPPLGEAVNGTWMIWVVGTQSVAAAAAQVASLDAGARTGFAFVAVALWVLGVVLYLVLITIVTLRMLVAELAPEQLTHAYWVAMGATAISVLTAARILELHTRLPIATEALTAVTFAFWVFGSWWIPLLLLLGLWRHLLRRVPLSYHPSLWSMVFPLSMY
ncbi:MAG: tellurite resistance/C4-dicarboxylate transporter family protein, partial [Candidatus Dormibacteraceae bacterium]